MILNHRIVLALVAGLVVLFSLSTAPVAFAGFEPCVSTCSWKPPSAGCSCSNPYFNINCAYYLENGCSLYRGGQPSDAAQTSAQAELSCPATGEVAPVAPSVEAPVVDPIAAPALVASE